MNDVERQLDARALAWLRERMLLACDMAQSVEELRSHGYTDNAILAGFEAVRPRVDSVAAGALRSPPLLRRPPPKLRRLEVAGIDAYTLDDFMSAKECARLVGLISHHLRPSTLAYSTSDENFRTSTTADLCHLRSPVALGVDEKICRALGIRAEFSEGIQAQRYDVGQQFKAHWDYFEPESPTYRRLAGVRGNRTWTFMVYLNDGMEGGATRFTKVDHAVLPKTGMALLWKNLHEDGTPNIATMHCGEPVTRGHKIIITKWFRVYGDGEVFHD